MAARSYNPELSRSKFKNWIKAGLGILYTKEGIEPFVYDEIETFQKKCLKEIYDRCRLPTGTKCSSCRTENIVVCPTNRICNGDREKCRFHRNNATRYIISGCPKKICHNFVNKIKYAHRFRDPSFENTAATKWCSNPWEVAKCFMPPDGYKNVTNAAETDFDGLIGVIINYKAFQSKFHEDLSKTDNIVWKARHLGNALRHSSDLGAEDGDLQQYLSTLQSVLSDPGYLATHTASQNARKKLSELDDDTLVIGINDIRNVLNDVVTAVHDKLRTEKDEHKAEAEKQKLELIKITNKYVNAYEKQGKMSMHELEKALLLAIDEKEAPKKKSIIEDHSTQLTLHSEAKEDLDTVPSEMDLDKISRAIGLNWELLGPHLGLSKVRIECIQMDNDTSQKRIYQMFYNWQAEQGPNGTLRNLFEVFRNQPSTSIDWEILGRSFPDAPAYKPSEE
ncbi:uncharacterized protein LOC128554347, partial [Mercenaria mercenaria]|uniref:uncharacterized protein LOC128554347 n=1 Tax=Mercenaria mercenaria TaxID=6596 RepID=UPI00234F8044